jgi:hypothetical protein
MRRGLIIGAALLAVVAVVGIVVGAYNVGLHHAVTQEVVRSGDRVEVVRGWGYGPGYGYGFFPFGFILFPLFVIGIILLLRGLFWRGRSGGPGGWGGYGPRGYGPGGYGPGGPGGWGQSPWQQRFDDWHRRQHEQPGEAGEQAGEPGGPAGSGNERAEV